MTGNPRIPWAKVSRRFGFGMLPVPVRVIYLAKFVDAVYLLNCFQKKTEKTSKADVDLAAKRYRDLLKELGQ